MPWLKLCRFCSSSSSSSFTIIALARRRAMPSPDLSSRFRAANSSAFCGVGDGTGLLLVSLFADSLGDSVCSDRNLVSICGTGNCSSTSWLNSCSSCDPNPVGVLDSLGISGESSSTGGEICFLCTGGDTSLNEVPALRNGCGLKSSSLPFGMRACLGSCAVPALAHRCPSAIPPGTRADPERDIAALRLLTSLGGSSVSSPPSPMISGIVLTKPTTNPGRRVGFVKPFGFDARAVPSNGVDALAKRTSCALGQR